MGTYKNRKKNSWRGTHTGGPGKTRKRKAGGAYTQGTIKTRKRKKQEKEKLEGDSHWGT